MLKKESDGKDQMYLRVLSNKIVIVQIERTNMTLKRIIIPNLNSTKPL